MNIKHLNAPSLAVMSGENMKERFIYKIENLGERGFADYILTSTEYLEDRIERAKASIADLQDIVKSCQGQTVIIKQEVEKFMSANGVEKLEGDRVSSLTLFKPKDKSKLVLLDEHKLAELGYIKVEIDAKAIEANLDKIPKELYEIQTIAGTPTIKINKKRGM